jgi:hypothetical protein
MPLKGSDLIFAHRHNRRGTADRPEFLIGLDANAVK